MLENLQAWFQRYFVDNGATSWWLEGLKTTVLVTLLALCIGVVLGFLIAIIRTTHEQTGKLKLLNLLAKIYLTGYPRYTVHDSDFGFSIPWDFCQCESE